MSYAGRRGQRLSLVLNKLLQCTYLWGFLRYWVWWLITNWGCLVKVGCNFILRLECVLISRSVYGLENSCCIPKFHNIKGVDWCRSWFCLHKCMLADSIGHGCLSCLAAFDLSAGKYTDAVTWISYLRTCEIISAIAFKEVIVFNLGNLSEFGSVSYLLILLDWTLLGLWSRYLLSIPILSQLHTQKHCFPFHRCFDPTAEVALRSFRHP